MLDYLAYQAVIAVFIVLTFVLSAVETSVISSNPIRLRALFEKGSRSAGHSLHVLENIEAAMGALQIMINIIEISLSAFIAFVATRAFFLGETGLFIVTLVQTVFLLTFCEVLPKVIARSRPETVLNIFSRPLIALSWIFTPLTRFALFLSRGIKRAFGLAERYSFISSRDDIGYMFRAGVSEGVLDEDHHGFVDEILTLSQVTAYEVMTPLIDIVSIERRQSIRQLIGLISEKHYSRIPVYEDRVDNIVGYVHYRDLLVDTGIRHIDEILTKPHFVPSTKNLHALYHEMLEQDIPVVFVVNEFGAVEGMATREDIAEEIVGEIQTRDHHEEELIEPAGRNRFVVRGGVDIDYIKRKFNIPIEKRGFETLAGFVLHRMGRIPRRGERFVYEKTSFVIEEATDRSIERVLIVLPGGSKV